MDLQEFMKMIERAEVEVREEKPTPPKEEENKYAAPDGTSLVWEDIIGLSEAKEQMIEAIVLPHTEKEIFAYYNKKAPKGILLYGPPGCGKTLLAKAAATALAKTFGASAARSGFMYVKAPEVLHPHVGAAEAIVRDIFKQAKKHQKKHGYPAVIFIDEADAVMQTRGSTHWGDSLVTAFLTEMDGMDDSAAIVILATNRPDSLDPAIVREGRIDRKIKVTRPSLEDTANIVMLNLRKVPVSKVDKEDLAQRVATMMFAPERIIYEVDFDDDEMREMSLHHFVNGAMVTAVVDYAAALAIRRDLTNKTMTGVMMPDVEAAVEYIHNQQRDLNHIDEIKEFASHYAGDVTAVKKANHNKKMKVKQNASTDQSPKNVFGTRKNRAKEKTFTFAA